MTIKCKGMFVGMLLFVTLGCGVSEKTPFILSGYRQESLPECQRKVILRDHCW